MTEVMIAGGSALVVGALWLGALQSTVNRHEKSIDQNHKDQMEALQRVEDKVERLADYLLRERLNANRPPPR